jgi:glycosyltransferase involved in cell wall biosynthesis
LSNYINCRKIFVAKNTLDTKYLLQLRHEFKKEGRDDVKRRLGFKKKFNVIYIGRLLPEKLPELLIEMLGYLPLTQSQNIEIHFVGDGKERSNLECLVKNLNLEQSVRFHGAIYDDILTGAYLFASDLMILPGEIGLSVNHAFCFDCPVMTFKRKSGGPFHGPEEEYIINGVTGFQLEEHSVLAIARQVTSYLENNEIQDLIRSNISTYVQTDLSVDNMVRGFEDAINYVIAK